jgi:hypothetical protein
VVEYRIEQHLERLGDRLERLGLRAPSVTGKDTTRGDGVKTKNPDSTEVLPGQKLLESGRPDSNRRRPAWEAGILPLNYARESRENVRTTPRRVKSPYFPSDASRKPRRRDSLTAGSPGDALSGPFPHPPLEAHQLEDTIAFNLLLTRRILGPCRSR